MINMKKSIFIFFLDIILFDVLALKIIETNAMIIYIEMLNNVINYE